MKPEKTIISVRKLDRKDEQPKYIVEYSNGLCRSFLSETKSIKEFIDNAGEPVRRTYSNGLTTAYIWE